MEGLLNELHPATFRLFQQPFDYPGNFSIIQQLFDFRQRTSIVVEAQYPKFKVSLFNFDEKSPKSTKQTYAFFFSHDEEIAFYIPLNMINELIEKCED